LICLLILSAGCPIRELSTLFLSPYLFVMSPCFLLVIGRQHLVSAGGFISDGLEFPDTAGVSGSGTFTFDPVQVLMSCRAFLTTYLP